MSKPADPGITIHGSCVTFGNGGILILGPSGSGKSGLALQLMAYGAALVADDQTHIEQTENSLVASCPPQIAGKIEARGVGILAATHKEQTVVRLVVDMGKTETDRLPEQRRIELLNCVLPVLYVSDTTSFAAAIVQFMKNGRIV